MAELLVFAIFFSAFSYARYQNVALFNQQQLLLNREFALVNTLMLITSSYFVVRALAAMQEGFHTSCFKWLLLALLMGFGFVVIKSIEYVEYYSQGINLRTNLFFMFYFSLTFFHFLHVVMGMIILTVNAYKTRQLSYSAENMTGLETGASYWHMVDMVWLILFPLVYVMR